MKNRTTIDMGMGTVSEDDDEDEEGETVDETHY